MTETVHILDLYQDLPFKIGVDEAIFPAQNQTYYIILITIS